MPNWFGSGGVTAEVPSRTFPQMGTTEQAPNLEGGARGPEALPSRVSNPRLARPAPADPRPGGPVGPISFHRGAFVENAGAPRLCATGELGHDLLPWSRPTYPNVAGRLGYHDPTHQPSWSANRVSGAGMPASPIPVSTKRIANFMVREEYGSTRQLVPGGSLAGYVAHIQRGLNQEGKGWLARSKMRSPKFPRLSVWGQSGSYGQTTQILPTAPANVAGTTPNGAY